ncbi:MAG: hypothetical protein H5T61_14855 [Thermoflexales bacterium]|nr:hypothetical protein [Thermoflexales bacterium]
MGYSDVRRIQITIPTSLLEEIQQYVPLRERNRFLVQAAEKELRRLKLRRQPAWSDEDHPDLQTPEDVDRYVRSLREAWEARLAEIVEGIE